MRLEPSNRFLKTVEIVKNLNSLKGKMFETESKPLAIESMKIKKPYIKMKEGYELQYRGDMMNINNNTKIFETG